jgi:MHS family proline/betaine transporter-like MFS transporter
VATFLIASTGNKLVPAIYLTVIAAAALLAAFVLPETSGRSMRTSSGAEPASGANVAAAPGSETAHRV